MSDEQTPQPVTFRDFASAAMSGDQPKAASVLETLLDVDADAAAAAAAHFQQQMAAQGQPFLMKSMGLRAAVTSGSDDDIAGLLADCFGIEGDAAVGPVAALKTRYRG